MALLFFFSLSGLFPGYILFWSIKDPQDETISHDGRMTFWNAYSYSAHSDGFVNVQNSQKSSKKANSFASPSSLFQKYQLVYGYKNNFCEHTLTEICHINMDAWLFLQPTVVWAPLLLVYIRLAVASYIQIHSPIFQVFVDSNSTQDKTVGETILQGQDFFLFFFSKTSTSQNLTINRSFSRIAAPSSHCRRKQTLTKVYTLYFGNLTNSQWFNNLCFLNLFPLGILPTLCLCNA